MGACLSKNTMSNHSRVDLPTPEQPNTRLVLFPSVCVGTLGTPLLIVRNNKDARYPHLAGEMPTLGAITVKTIVFRPEPSRNTEYRDVDARPHVR